MVVVKLLRARSASRVRRFSYVCIQEFFVLSKSSICLSVRPPLHVSGCVLNPRQEQIVFNLVLSIHVMINDSCQNREFADQCLMAVLQTPVYTLLEVTCFLKFSVNQLWHSSDRRLRKLSFRKVSYHESFTCDLG